MPLARQLWQQASRRGILWGSRTPSMLILEGGFPPGDPPLCESIPTLTNNFATKSECTSAGSSGAGNP